MFKFISSRIFFIFLFLSPLTTFAQLEANFSASDSTICEGDTIDFTDLTIGGVPNVWVWSFPGAVPPNSALQNPVDIVYPTAGVYDVLLGVVIIFPLDTDSIFAPGLITVNVCATPLNASFSFLPDPICEGDAVDFFDESDGSGITNWDWIFEGATTPASVLENPIDIVFPDAGTFDVTLSVTDAFGTDDTIVSITVSTCATPLVADFSISQALICAGDTVDFTDESTGGVIDAWNWNFEGAAPLNSVVQNPIQIIYSTAGTFDITLEVTSGLISDDTVATITVQTCEVNVDIDASETIVCLGECIDFTDLTGGVITAHEWNFEGAETNNSTAPNPTNICYLTPGTFDVALTVTVDGVMETQNFPNFITVVDTCGIPFANFEYEPLVCQGSCVNYNNASSNGEEYLWTFEGATPSTSTLENPTNICYNTIGSFDVTLTVTNGAFSNTSTQTVDVVVGPTISAGPDITMNAGATVILTAVVTGGTGDGTFEWQPFEEVSNFSAQSVSISPNESTLFIVSYQEENGCKVFDEVNVIVNQVASAGVPSAFSPNKDGINDVLRVLGEGISKLEFKIFNRYGQLVFESNNIDNGWDGLHNDKEVNPGVFTYYAKVTYIDGDTEILRGNVTLIH